MIPCGYAAAVFWIGLRRGWWVSLIAYILKFINSKGKPKSQQKKKRKSKHKKKERSSKAPEPGDGTEAWSGLVDSSTAAAAEGGAAGAAAAAKALSNGMQNKRKSGKSGSADEIAQRES